MAEYLSPDHADHPDGRQDRRDGRGRGVQRDRAARVV